jgi:hypothetical protein
VGRARQAFFVETARDRHADHVELARDHRRRFLPDPPTIIPGNDILPWEMEALLVELGWQVLDQQPRVGRTVRGPASPYSEAMVSRLPDRLLQQAVATAWQFVATPQSET